jgi:hypothetical protein
VPARDAGGEHHERVDRAVRERLGAGSGRLTGDE